MCVYELYGKLCGMKGFSETGTKCIFEHLLIENITTCYNCAITV